MSANFSARINPGWREAALMGTCPDIGSIRFGKVLPISCQLAGPLDNCQEVEGLPNPAAYVISLNLHRRHLNESQRSMVAARLANIRNDQFRGNRFVDSANLQSLDRSISQSEAGNLLNVSGRSVANAKVVQRKGIPDLQKAVEAGEVSVSAAADVATITADE